MNGVVEQTQQAKPKKHQAHSWWRVFLVGLGLYVLALAALVLTGNPNLFPTVMLVGNLLVPVTYVVFFYERKQVGHLTLPATGLSFVYGGLLGVIAASILEPVFIRRVTVISAFGIGLIEEFVKILGVLVVARHRRHGSEINGLVLGAAAGMGFAALESSGYAFTAFLQSQGSLSAEVSTTLLRGILSPLGHGTWTAILVAVLFRESRGGHYRINLAVLGTYLGVAALHGLWDGIPAALSNIVGSGFDILIGQLFVGAVGLFILAGLWRQGVRRQEQAEAEAAAAATQATEITEGQAA